MPAASLARGRTLAEFEPLRPAERTLLHACLVGEEAAISARRPMRSGTRNSIRAEFIRFLVLGGDRRAPVHQSGVQVTGAFVEGPLILDACDRLVRLSLSHCQLDKGISARDAAIAGLALTGSRVAGIRADRLHCSGSIFLRNGFEATAEVRMLGARVNGNFDCSDSSFRGYEPKDGDSEPGDALSLDRITVGGNVNLSGTFLAAGAVRLLNGCIGGDLDCVGGTILNPGFDALSCHGIEIGKNAFLRESFHAEGSVCFNGAEIGGRVELQGSHFSAGTGLALDFDSAVIKGVLQITGIASLNGGINFGQAHVAALRDDEASWSKASYIILDGFHYDQIIGPCTARSRLEWLRKQPDAHLGASLRPGPWEYLAAMLRAMGHSEDARAISTEKQWTRLRAGAIGQRPVDGVTRPRAAWNLAMNRLSMAVHWLYGTTAAFGYRPFRTVIWMAAIWATCAIAYDQGEQRGVFGPSAVAMQISPTLASCGAPGDTYQAPTRTMRRRALARAILPAQPWTRCDALPAAHPAFNPWIYSLDLILPVVDLRQDQAWAPMVATRGGKESLPWGWWLQVAMWVEILLGWLGSLLLVSVLGKLVKQD